MTSSFIDRPGGTIHQLLFGQSDMTLIDVSEDAVILNWTSAVSPAQFVLNPEIVMQIDIADESEDGRIAARLSTRRRWRKLSARAIAELAAKEPATFNADCGFVRFDFSSTESVAWQRLTHDEVSPDLDPGIGFVGYGQDLLRIDLYGLPYWVDKLLSDTSTPLVADHKQKILDDVQELARRWRERR